MPDDAAQSNLQGRGSGEFQLKFLDAAQVEMIDEALCQLGDFGEIRLLVQKGRLRFVVMQESHDVLKWKSGTRLDSKDRS